MSVTSPDSADGLLGSGRWRTPDHEAVVWWLDDETFCALDRRHGIVRHYELTDGHPNQWCVVPNGTLIMHAVHGARVALASSEEVVVADAVGEEEVCRLESTEGEAWRQSLCLFDGGRRLAVATELERVFVFDLDAPQDAPVIVDLDKPVERIEASSSGALFAVVQRISGRPNSVCVVEAASGEVRAELEGARTTIRGLRWSSDDECIWAASGKNLMGWRADGTQLFRKKISKGDVYDVHVSTDDAVLVTCTEKEGMTAWDAQTGDELWSKLRVRRIVHVTDEEVIHASFSEMNTSRLADGHELRAWLGFWATSHVAMHPSRPLLLASHRFHKGLGIWDVSVGNRLDEPEGHQERITNHAFDATGERLLTMDWAHRAWLWDVEAGEHLARMWKPRRRDERGTTITGATFSGLDDSLYLGFELAIEHRSADGEVLAEANVLSSASCLVHLPGRRELLVVLNTGRVRGYVQVHDDETLELKRQLEVVDRGTYESVRVMDEDTVRLEQTSGYDVLDVQDMEIIASRYAKLDRLEADGKAYHSGHRWLVLTDPEREYGIVRSTHQDESQLVGVDLRTKQVLWFEYFERHASSLAVDPNGRWFVQVFDHGEVEWRELRTGRLLASVDARPMKPERVFVSPDGRRTFVSSREGELAWWVTPDLEIDEVIYEDHARTSTHFGDLRELLQGTERSETSWRRLCVLVDQFEGPELVEQVLPYTTEVLEAWPPGLRVAPTQWVEHLVTSGSEPRMRLARVIEGAMHDASIEAVALSEDVEDVAIWRTTHSEIGAPGARALASASRWEGLTTLDLGYATITNDVLQILADAPWVPGLEVLRLGGKYGKNTGLKAFLEHTGMVNLRELSLDRTKCRGRGFVGALQRAEHLSGLKVLDVSYSKLRLEVITGLGWLDELERLDIAGLEATSAHLVHFFERARVPSLRVIDIGRITDVGREELWEALFAWPQLPKLEALKYWGGRPSEAQLMRLLELGESFDEETKDHLTKQLQYMRRT